MHLLRRVGVIAGIALFGALPMFGCGMFSSGAPNGDELAEEVDQGWTAGKRAQWYAARQGSRLIPLAWLTALEQPGGEALFMQPEHVARFGYIPRKTDNGHQLAIGFAVDSRDDTQLERTRLRWKEGQGPKEPWVGLTCAACHTAELSYNGQSIRVDGGPATADFQSFIEALNQALRETDGDEGKWKRFAERVLGGSAETDADRKLKAEFRKLLDWQEREARMNQTSVRYGFGRVDAFGRIYNKVALLVNAPQPKANAPDAPVSIPFIWRAPQLDFVQYNGIAPKKALFRFDLGALARNTGEVTGVFGDVKVTDGSLLAGFPSSIDVRNLVSLERQLMKLRPPKWPESLFGLKSDLVAKGRESYERHCVRCHAVVDRNDLEKPIQVQMNLFDGSSISNVDGKPVGSPGTDPWMACNAQAYATPSGVFAGKLSFDGQRIPETAPISNLLKMTVAKTLLDRKKDITKEALATALGLDRPPLVETDEAVPQPAPGRRSPEKQAQLDLCLRESAPNLGYTSRPLNGIWATGPYLHNGSVPTLHDLLLPPDQRPKSFYVGTREFDPEHVGYLTIKEDLSKQTPRERAEGNTFEFISRDEQGLGIDANSNAGHDYGNASLEGEREALIEYLKSL